MKSSDIWLLGIAGLVWYWYNSRTNVLKPYPAQWVPPKPKPTGSGGVTASGGSGNPLPGGTVPQGGSVPTGSGGVVAQGSYYTCPDGTLTNDPSLCTAGGGYVTCPDGTLTNDLSLCPSTAMDTMDPCDPNSIAYDPNSCGISAGSIGGGGMGIDGGGAGGSNGSWDVFADY